MTIAVSSRFGERIVTVSDTVIVDPNAARPNVLPGRLKSVVLNDRVTVTYAGLANQALTAIRQAWRALGKGATVADVEELLRSATDTYGGHVDFLVASHIPEPRLTKIAGGQVFCGADYYWIGDREAANSVSRVAQQFDRMPSTGDVSEGELRFVGAFLQLVANGQRDSVGGMAFVALASPYGHCYQDHVAAVAWDRIELGRHVDDGAYAALMNTGMYHFRYHALSCSRRGAGVSALYLEQAKLGFLYSPLHMDEPFKLYPATLLDVRSMVEEHGERLIRKSTTT